LGNWDVLNLPTNGGRKGRAMQNRIVRMAMFALAWLALATVFGSMLYPINMPKLRQLVAHGARATAQVTKLDCANHNRAFYAFRVGIVEYSGHDGMPGLCEEMRGETIIVYYDRTNPASSIAREPRAALENETVSIAAVCLLFPTIILFIVSRRLRRPIAP
jgi:hypothetical protein